MESLLGLGTFGVFITWLSCAVIGGMVGQRKGSSLIGTLLGLVFGPLGVAFSIAMVGSRAECLFCRELVRWQAKKCPHCQSVLTNDPLPKPSPVVFVDENGKVV